jgi:2-methylisocitrate lyase-like PEP mutase family enzyme
MTPAQLDRAVRFAALHRGPAPLVLPNAWDAASALLFQAAGFPAVATTSAGLAWSLGHRDGEELPLAALVAAVARIAAVLQVPLSVDLEAGYGRTPEEVAEVVMTVIAAGAVGVNVEDADRSGAAPLRDPGLQVEILHAVKDAGRAAELPLFVNARTDVFWKGIGGASDRLEQTLERLRAYLAAGADGVFVPGLKEPADLAAVASGVEAPLNVLATPGLPPVPELAKLGVARLTIGSGAMRAAYGKLRRIAAELQGPGTYESLAEDALTGTEMQALIP